MVAEYGRTYTVSSKVYRDPLPAGTVASICRVSRKTIFNWIHRGALRSFTTPGGHHRVWPADLQEFLDQAGLDIRFKFEDKRQTRILIVNDDSYHRMVLLKSFRERFPDASVVATHSAYEALLLVGEQKPEVVTWDLNLPGTDGSRIIELLQSRRRNTSIHVALSHRHRHAELEWHAFAGPARSEKTGTGLAEMLNSLQSMIGITPARQAYPRLMQFDRTPAVPAMSHLILTD